MAFPGELRLMLAAHLGFTVGEAPGNAARPARRQLSGAFAAIPVALLPKGTGAKASPSKHWKTAAQQEKQHRTHIMNNPPAARDTFAKRSESGLGKIRRNRKGIRRMDVRHAAKNRGTGDIL